MIRNNMDIKAFKNKVYAEGFGEFVRTEPATGYNAPYIGYIKTTLGEATVPYDNKIVYEVLTSGNEITEKEYNKAKLIAVNGL